jgi:hypothetical protein
VGKRLCFLHRIGKPPEVEKANRTDREIDAIDPFRTCSRAPKSANLLGATGQQVPSAARRDHGEQVGVTQPCETFSDVGFHTIRKTASLLADTGPFGRIDLIFERGGMMKAASCISVVLLLCANTAIAQHQRVVERLRIGKDIQVFHADKIELRGGVIAIVGPQDSEGHDEEFIAALSGIADHTFLSKRSYGLRNGIAGIGMRDGRRYIIWDPSWGTGTGFSWYVLAHEIGHHVCGHTIASYLKSPHEQELEADRFAGEAMRRDSQGQIGPAVQGAVDEIVQYMQGTFSREGSASHPPVAMRVAAFMDGYRNGSSCK